MYRAPIHLEDRPRNVRAGNKDARIEVKGETVEVLANDIHEVVTIEYSNDRSWSGTQDRRVA